MPRRPKPWYRRDRAMFYTTIAGKQYPLNVTDQTDEAGAWTALKALISKLENRPASRQPIPKVKTVQEAVESFLRIKSSQVAPITLKNYARHLAHFIDDFGPCQLGALDGKVVPNRAKLRKWSDTNTANYLATVEACLVAADSPLKFDKPSRESAGADAVIPEAVYKACLRETKGDFQQYIRFLWATGCRPGEVSRLTFDMIDRDARVITLSKHKTRRQTKRPRLVYLGSEALGIIDEQRAKYGTGSVFRGHRGKPYSLQAVVNRFWRLSRKVKHRLSAYDFRHTFATRALSSGIPDAQVAALLGHTSTTMVNRHYNHVSHNAKLMKGLADKLGG